MSDDLNGSIQSIWDPTPDSFGVPRTFFGQHDEEFYGAVGRVALLSALTERRVRLLASKLVLPRVNKKGETVPEASVTKLIERATPAASTIEGEDARDAVKRFLVRAQALIKRRNVYLHSLWPAQADGSLFGWKAEPWDGEERIKPATLREDIIGFVELNQQWSRVWPVLSSRLAPVIGSAS